MISVFFGDEGHWLGGLVQEFGGQLEAYDAIGKAAAAEIESKGLGDGLFSIATKVGSQIVTVTGRIKDGIINIGTAFTPGP
jgi:hypothetical protein